MDGWKGFGRWGVKPAVTMLWCCTLVIAPWVQAAESQAARPGLAHRESAADVGDLAAPAPLCGRRDLIGEDLLDGSGCRFWRLSAWPAEARAAGASLPKDADCTDPNFQCDAYDLAALVARLIALDVPEFGDQIAAAVLPPDECPAAAIPASDVVPATCGGYDLRDCWQMPQFSIAIQRSFTPPSWNSGPAVSTATANVIYADCAALASDDRAAQGQETAWQLNRQHDGLQQTSRQAADHWNRLLSLGNWTGRQLQSLLATARHHRLALQLLEATALGSRHQATAVPASAPSLSELQLAPLATLPPVARKYATTSQYHTPPQPEQYVPAPAAPVTANTAAPTYELRAEPFETVIDGPGQYLYVRAPAELVESAPAPVPAQPCPAATDVPLAAASVIDWEALIAPNDASAYLDLGAPCGLVLRARRLADAAPPAVATPSEQDADTSLAPQTTIEVLQVGEDPAFDVVPPAEELSQFSLVVVLSRVSPSISPAELWRQMVIHNAVPSWTGRPTFPLPVSAVSPISVGREAAPIEVSYASVSQFAYEAGRMLGTALSELGQRLRQARFALRPAGPPAEVAPAERLAPADAAQDAPQYPVAAGG